MSTPREVLEPQLGDLVEYVGAPPSRWPPGIVIAITHEYAKWNNIRAVVQWADYGDRDPFGYEFKDLKILSKAPHPCAA